MLTDERYKQLIKDYGLQDCSTILNALKQCAMDSAIAERKECAMIAEKYEPDEKLDSVSYASIEILSRCTIK